MEFFEILSARRNSLGMSFDILSEKSGVPVSTLKKLFTGVTRAPQLDTLTAVTHALGLTLDDLDDAAQPVSPAERDLLAAWRNLDDYGRAAVRAVLDAEAARVQAERQADPPRVIRLPHYCDAAAAGAPLDASSDYYYDDLPASAVPAGADFCVDISGRSMEPTIEDGAVVFVRKSVTADDGDIVIAWVDGEGTVCKRLACGASGRVSRLCSDNPEFPDITGRALRDLRIYGVVIK